MTGVFECWLLISMRGCAVSIISMQARSPSLVAHIPHVTSAGSAFWLLLGRDTSASVARTTTENSAKHVSNAAILHWLCIHIEAVEVK